jgi:hypothetical protein
MRGKIVNPRQHIFFRYCDDCGKRFQPTGVKERFCKKCYNKRFMFGVMKRRYLVNRKKYLSLMKKIKIKDVTSKKRK